MKIKRLIKWGVWSRICSTMLFGLSLSFGYGQDASVATGGDANGNGGSASYSIGQVLYTFYSGINGSISQGVQQAYEIYSVGFDAMDVNIGMTVFPNPTTDNLTLQVNRVEDAAFTYQLIDIQGRLLEQDLVQTQTQINARNLPSGVYMLIVRQGIQPIRTFKIIKSK